MNSLPRTLTPREQQILDCVWAGYDNKTSGARLGISPRTVEVHRYRIMRKMQARNVAQLIRVAMQWGLIREGA